MRSCWAVEGAALGWNMTILTDSGLVLVSYHKSMVNLWAPKLLHNFLSWGAISFLTQLLCWLPRGLHQSWAETRTMVLCDITPRDVRKHLLPLDMKPTHTKVRISSKSSWCLIGVAYRMRGDYRSRSNSKTATSPILPRNGWQIMVIGVLYNLR